MPDVDSSDTGHVRDGSRGGIEFPHPVRPTLASIRARMRCSGRTPTATRPSATSRSQACSAGRGPATPGATGARAVSRVGLDRSGFPARLRVPDESGTKQAREAPSRHRAVNGIT